MSSVIGQYNKRIRLEIEENIADRAAEKTILDVDNDCLEYVFNFLGFGDLISVAEANKYLKVTSETVFFRKIQNRKMVVNIAKNFPAEINICDNAIIIHRLWLAVKAIRLFGQNISEISLEVNKDILGNKLLTHVNEYCHKTLNSLYFSGRDSKVLADLKHPFEQVEKFLHEYVMVGDGYEHFNRIFPRLRQLQIHNHQISNAKSIHQSFPNLETFDSIVDFFKGYTFFTDEDLKAIVTLNPQLQSFGLIGLEYCHLSIWEPINAGLKSLKSISAVFSAVEADLFENRKLVFDCVEVFNAECHSYKIGEVKPVDVFSFKCLKKLTVKIHYGSLGPWLDLVLANPTITELEIWKIGEFSLSGILYDLENNHEKLKKCRQNVKCLSLRLDSVIFKSHVYEQKYDNYDCILELPKILNENDWFNMFSVQFDYSCYYECISAMERFLEALASLTQPIENYKMKKHITTIKRFAQNISLDFEKCE